MKFNFHNSILHLILFSLLIILSGCGGDSSSSPYQVSLELGEEVPVASSSVGTGETIITVDDDSPIDGMVVTVPSGAYQETTAFAISYSPITSSSGNKNINPATPLITIKNGGEYADEIIRVKIPVTMEEGYHYMAFYYDETTGALEGIPELEHDNTSITIATRHFSSLYINYVGWTMLLGDFDSGFKVQQDNWQFQNLGTYLSPGGVCSGMSIASLYYYLEKKKKEGYPPLFAFYENGSAAIDEDDEQAIKLCSKVQWWDKGSAVDNWYGLGDEKKALWTYLMFAHSIEITREPQYVSLYTADDEFGHALVVYKKSGNNLYVADPNLPNDSDVKIVFEPGVGETESETLLNGKFKSFESQWNKDTDKIDFTKVYYIGKSALIELEDLAPLWDNLDNGTVAWNRQDVQSLHTDYPDYSLKIIEEDNNGIEKESPLTNGYKTSNSIVKVKVDDPGYRINVFYEDTTARGDNNSEIIEVNLESGENRIGFLLETELDSDATGQKEWTWTDFNYFTLERGETGTSISVTNTLEQNITIMINGEYPGSNASNGYLEPGETMTQPYAAGTYTILVASTNGSVEYTRQIDLGSGDTYVYDFENSQDCDKGKLTISNQTAKNVKLYRDGSYWYSIDTGEVDTHYFSTGTVVSISAKTPTWEGLCYSDCVYACWAEQIFTLDCQGDTWVISGSGTTCP